MAPYLRNFSVNFIHTEETQMLSPNPHHEPHTPSFTTRASQVATVVLALNIAFFTVFIVAWILGWFSLSTSTSDTGQSQLVIAFSSREVAADVNHSIKEMSKTTESLATAADQQAAQGEIVAIDADAKMVTVTSEGVKNVKVAITRITKIELSGEESTFSKLQQGDIVRVIYKENDGQFFALKIKQVSDAADNS